MNTELAPQTQMDGPPCDFDWGSNMTWQLPGSPECCLPACLWLVLYRFRHLPGHIGWSSNKLFARFPAAQRVAHSKELQAYARVWMPPHCILMKWCVLVDYNPGNRIELGHTCQYKQMGLCAFRSQIVFQAHNSWCTGSWERWREWSNIKPAFRSIRLKIIVFLRSDVQI